MESAEYTKSISTELWSIPNVETFYMNSELLFFTEFSLILYYSYTIW